MRRREAIAAIGTIAAALALPDTPKQRAVVEAKAKVDALIAEGGQFWKRLPDKFAIRFTPAKEIETEEGLSYETLKEGDPAQTVILGWWKGEIDGQQYGDYIVSSDWSPEDKKEIISLLEEQAKWITQEVTQPGRSAAWPQELYDAKQALYAAEALC